MEKTTRIYHCSDVIVESPEIRISKFNKDFYFGFYCTIFRQQAVRWATRYTLTGYVSEYDYTPDETLKVKKFNTTNDEWLDFIIDCRSGKKHNYDIVEGPMADDTIYNYLQDYLEGNITRAAFFELAKFKKPTHQISFHTANALATLKFIKATEER
jgi:hypothetical protein